MRGAVLLVCAACAGAVHPVRHDPPMGTIAGLARDHDTGDPVAEAAIAVRADGKLESRMTSSGDHGLFDIAKLAPGRYSLNASFAGQVIDIENIDVRAGEVTVIDLVFTLGQPSPIHIDWGDPSAAQIDHYRPAHLVASQSIIEGTVNDVQTRGRIAGAVVTAVGGPRSDTKQTVSDDQGRYRFAPLLPGTYAISAYYSVSGHGQIEVRRSEIAVAGAEAVVVPLWLETTR